MDIEDELFDVSYGKINEKDKAKLLSDWIAGERNIISIGERYTEKMLTGWLEIASAFENVGQKCDKYYVQELIKNGFFQKTPHGPIFAAFEAVRNSRSDNDSRLVVAIIVDAIRLTREVDNKHRTRSNLFGAVATQLPKWVLDFTNMWQFALNLQLDESFVRSLYWNMAASMRLSQDQILDKISEYSFVSKQLTGNERLYFAYGSNMNKNQMSHRTENARLLGWADLSNFQYFIDGRGVASVAPRIGKSVKGLLWDIQSDSDWKKLDRYEGIKSGLYNKFEMDVCYRSQTVKSTIYVSSVTSIGEPRPGYQDGIISAVLTECRRADAFLDTMDGLDPEDFDDQFRVLFDDWHHELSGWSRA
jgi:hypothetical protein